jgi:hypothetical protein
MFKNTAYRRILKRWVFACGSNRTASGKNKGERMAETFESNLLRWRRDLEGLEGSFRHLVREFDRLTGARSGSDEVAEVSVATPAAGSEKESGSSEPGEVRGIVRAVRFNRSEWEQVTTAAKSAGVAPAVYMRSTLLGKRPKARAKGVEREAVAQLARVGNNLNQIARKANAGGLEAEERAELSAALVEVRAIIEQLTGSTTETGNVAT